MCWLVLGGCTSKYLSSELAACYWSKLEICYVVQSKYSPIKKQSNQNATEGLSYCIRYVDKDILNYEFILKPITIQRYRESFGQLGNTCTPCF